MPRPTDRPPAPAPPMSVPAPLRDRLAAWPHWPWALWGLYGALLSVTLGVLPRLPQPEAYHAFAETRTLLGIPRFGDVVSNLALLAAGVTGLALLWRRVAPGVPGASRERAGAADGPFRAVQAVFFAAVALIAPGSVYYHWAPDTARLFWDRLPLGLVAAAFPALVLAERAVLRGPGRVVLGLWLAVGPLSVAYWRASEALRSGDLRPYLLLQGVAMGGTAALLVALPPRRAPNAGYLAGILLYLAALACEQADHAIHAATAGAVSGHTLKHLLAAMAVVVLAVVLRRGRG